MLERWLSRLQLGGKHAPPLRLLFLLVPPAVHVDICAENVSENSAKMKKKHKKDRPLTTEA